MNITALRALSVLLFSLGLPPAFAAQADKASGLINFANDYANVLAPTDLRGLEQQLLEASRSNRYQIAVALYKKLPDGTTPENATEFADRLMVGSSLGDRGIVILVFLEQHRVRVEIGYGLEGLVPDAIAHRAAELAAKRFARGEYAAGLKDAIALLQKHADEATANVKTAQSRWEWLPDWMLAIGDAWRGFAFFVAHRHEIPKQLAVWWKSQDDENQGVLAVFFTGGALFVLVLLRPAVGAVLCMFLPLAWLRTSAMRWLFFRGTDASFERDWKTAGPPGPSAPREYYVFDMLYYGGTAVVLVGMTIGSFIAFVGHPGGFGGAGAGVKW